MPTYDYECGACGHRFELFQSMTAKVRRKCPECGKVKLQRLIGPGAGFLFKGDGFYITDYRSSSYQEGKKAEKSPASTDSGAEKSKSSDSSTPAKPAKGGGDAGGSSSGGSKSKKSPKS